LLAKKVVCVLESVCGADLSNYRRYCMAYKLLQQDFGFNTHNVVENEYEFFEVVRAKQSNKTVTIILLNKKND
jgi:hypothetical protein